MLQFPTWQRVLIGLILLAGLLIALPNGAMTLPSTGQANSPGEVRMESGSLALASFGLAVPALALFFLADTTLAA